MRTFTWPIALLLLGLLFQTVAFAVLNTVVPLWMEQADAAVWETGMVGSLRRTGFNGSYRCACVLCAVSTLLLMAVSGVAAWSGLRFLTGASCALVWVVVESALLRAGTLKTRGVVSSVFSLDDWKTAFDRASGQYGDFKVAFRF